MTDDAEINWYSDDTATFGDRLAAAREAQGLTQKSLARKMGITAKTLDGWENDLSEPRANRLPVLAGLLNVSMRWLLTGEGEGLDTAEAGLDPGDITEILSEMRGLHVQITQSAKRLTALEKRLKTALSEIAA